MFVCERVCEMVWNIFVMNVKRLDMKYGVFYLGFLFGVTRRFDLMNE